MLCLDLQGRSVAWWSQSPEEPADRNAPRQISTFKGVVWFHEQSNRIVELLKDGVGCLAVCRDGSTGHVLWRVQVPLPEPAEWAEALPAWPGAPTEELQAFLAQETDYLVVCIARTSRRWRTQEHDFPPYRSQLDLLRLDPVSGELMYQRSHADIVIDILERQHFVGTFRARRGAGIVDWSSGDARMLVTTPVCPYPPLSRLEDIVVGWKVRGGVELRAIERSNGAVMHAHFHKRSGVKRARLLSTDQASILHINSQFLLPLSAELEPHWEARTPPHVYSVLHREGEPIIVETAGQGGYLFVIDPATGAELLKEKTLYGVSELRGFDNCRSVVGLGGMGLVILNPSTLTTEGVKFTHSHDVWETYGSTVFVPDLGQRRAVWVEVE